MRAGGYTAQQALTADASILVKQSLNLARKRGHAQVTPLHVASTMLTSGGLLRDACQQSHSHPLQSKALELCFNVALNRLPTSSNILTTQISHHHCQQFPTLSNALIAAFKRAQAHQRRGSVEAQQQTMLAIKIEIEQLIISILDDPSVSRVMREAGLSSAQVKSNVEKVTSAELITSAMNINQKSNGNKRKEANVAVQGNKVMNQVRSEDVVRVLDYFSSGNKRCVVVVGECEKASQSVIRVVMDKIAKGEVADDLRNTQMIPLSLSSFLVLTRQEVDDKVSELKTLVRSCCLRQRGALIILEDFKWVCEEWGNSCTVKRLRDNNNGYSPFEHAMMEVRGLINGSLWSERVWLLGFCTSQSFMRCRSGQPSLETLWCLHSVSVSDGAQLALSLNCESEMQKQIDVGGENDINGCSDRFLEVQSLPTWLRQDKDDNQTVCEVYQGSSQLKDLCKKQNSVCNAPNICVNQAASDLTLNITSRSPSNPSFDLHNQSWSLPSCEIKQSWRDHHLWLSEANPTPDPNPNPNPNPSPSSSDGKITNAPDYHPKFKELNAENLKILCNALEKNVPNWHKGIVLEIASTVLQCRSGMTRRKERPKMDTWFSFRGTDKHGKENIARELARHVFGSHDHFVSIKFNTFCSSTDKFDSTHNDATNKRARLKNDHGYIERVFEALCDNPHRVIFLENIERLNHDFRVCILSAINFGKMRSLSGEEVCIDDAIVVLSCDVSDSVSCKDEDSGFGLDLNVVCDEETKDDDDFCLIDQAVDMVVLIETKENYL